MTYQPVHEMFQAAVERFGKHTAVEWEGRRTTYRELYDQANEIALRLSEAGAERGAPVAILATRTVDVIAAILGTLRAGCVFVPLDVHFPTARLEAIVSELRPRWWLVDSISEEPVERLQREGLAATIVPIPGAGEARGAAPPSRPFDPDDMAYIYFTSGSTGRPKAIAGRMKAIDHFLRWEIETFGIGADARVSQLTSFAFDAFLRDAFTPLSAGGRVCVPSGREVLMDGARLIDWIDQAGITLIHCTPSLFRAILGQELSADLFPRLRQVLLAGEPLLPADVRHWRSVFGDRVELVNLYGPSETTMVKLFHRLRPEDADAVSIPVGQPMPGARALVLDERGQACPPGKLGEIYIRTPYRALGYLNQPELTREVFVQNPWSDRPDDIVYRTGDLGRMRRDGSFEVLGRRDQQVKVRGVRIELGPVEEALRSHPAVKDAVVADRADTQGNSFLCAYVVAGGEVEPADLAQFLRQRLPEPMVPTAFVRLESLPRTLNGKVDRRSLPAPGLAARRRVPPQTPNEERLCRIFAELLGSPEVGIDDDFFQLGGHSLLATLLLSRIRSTFGVELPLHRILRTPTVRALALAVTELQAAFADEGELAALLAEVRSLPEEALDEHIEAEAGAGARGGRNG